MPLSPDQKKAVVAEVADVASRAHSAVAADYRGLTVEDMTSLRVQARASNVYLKVVKNTLARRAVDGTDFACLQEHMSGPQLYAFGTEDPASAARVIKDFAKTHPKLEVTTVAVGGKAFPAAELERVAQLPNREEALAMLAGTLRAPLNKLAQTVNEVPGKLVRTLAAIRDAKENEAA